jgi:hypothetical protein
MLGRLPRLGRRLGDPEAQIMRLADASVDEYCARASFFSRRGSEYTAMLL